jgi:hypothetical protein
LLVCQVPGTGELGRKFVEHQQILESKHQMSTLDRRDRHGN